MDYQTHYAIAKALGVLANRINKVSKISRYYGVDIPIHYLEIHVIEAVGDAGELRLTDLAESLSLTKGTVSLYVTRMAKKGLVCKHQKDGNRKEIYVRLTPLGEQAYRGHQAFHQRIYHHPTARVLYEDPIYNEENCRVILRFLADYCNIYDVMINEEVADTESEPAEAEESEDL